MFVSILGIATLSAYTAYATKQSAELPAVAGTQGPFVRTTTHADADGERAGSSTRSAMPSGDATTTSRAATPASTRATARSQADAATDYRAAIDRERRLGRTLVIAGLGALVVACAGLLLVGVRRRLW